MVDPTTAININSSGVTRGVMLSVRVSGIRVFRWRLTVALSLIRLAARILNVNILVVHGDIDAQG